MSGSKPKHVIVDTDAGLDDALALFMMFAAHNHHDVHIAAITCVFGNTDIHNVTKNVTRILQTVDQAQIPVFCGADSPLVIRHIVAEPFHGMDGFGDANLPQIQPLVQDETAVSAIVRLLDQCEPGSLSIMMLGPLTNLAATIRLKPDIKDKFKEILILGGNHESRGNITVCGEANFVRDAEAARIVLESFTCPITIVPLETFWLAYTSDMRIYRDSVLAFLPSNQMKLLNVIYERSLGRLNYWAVADAVAAAVFIEPKVITKQERHFCTVELQGSFTRGMMVVDKKNKLGKQPNATIITDIDLTLFQKVVTGGVGGPYHK